jgi:SAM-dependent methyltransferase
VNSSIDGRFDSTLQPIDNFPGWGKATAFLESLAEAEGSTRIVDIGGGANPMISAGFVSAHQISYALLDVSQTELDKAASHYTNKICVDLTAPPASFSSRVGSQSFDMAFSHMFLEHIADPIAAHRNIHSILEPGGLAVHLYPSAYNLPLALNRLLPESFSTAILRIAQPQRDLKGHTGKFPAYYKMCGNPTRGLRQQFEQLGYEVVTHCGFVGHDYYARFPVVRNIERLIRGLLVQAHIGLTSAQLLVLRRV